MRQNLDDVLLSFTFLHLPFSNDVAGHPTFLSRPRAERSSLSVDTIFIEIARYAFERKRVTSCRVGLNVTEVA